MRVPTNRRLPAETEILIVGSGPAGSALAAHLIDGSHRSVLLLEAGPDYGAYVDGGWPSELLDPTRMPLDRDHWGYLSAARHGREGLALERACLVGGCSSHNGCVAVWGHRRDYDTWAERGNPGWATDDLLPHFRRASAQLAVSTPPEPSLAPFHRLCLASGPAAGFPVLAELNDVDADLGIAIGPVNIRHGARWNASFAYLDPIRDRERFALRADVSVERVVVERGRAIAVEVLDRQTNERATIRAERIVLAGGVYGSPLILLRSGIGPVDHLGECGIPLVLPLPGVGENLQDHPAVHLRFAGTPRLRALMDGFAASGGLPREDGTIVLAQSDRCREAFDLHLYPAASPQYGPPEGGRRPILDWSFTIIAGAMTPRSRGRIRLGGAEATAPPIIDHGYLTDADDVDLAVLSDGVRQSRRLAASAPLADLIGEEIDPGPAIAGPDELAAHIRTRCCHDFHPVGGCTMGPASDPLAVVDRRGKVHGLDGLYVADASIMPLIPRANTNIPAAVIGERIASFFLDDLGSHTSPRHPRQG